MWGRDLPKPDQTGYWINSAFCLLSASPSPDHRPRLSSSSLLPDQLPDRPTELRLSILKSFVRSLLLGPWWRPDNRGRVRVLGLIPPPAPKRRGRQAKNGLSYSTHPGQARVTGHREVSDLQCHTAGEGRPVATPMGLTLGRDKGEPRVGGTHFWSQQSQYTLGYPAR